MFNTQKDQRARLVFQGSMPIENIVEGSKIHEAIKNFLDTINRENTLSGQIIKMLGPCCKEKEKPPNDKKTAEMVKR